MFLLMSMEELARAQRPEGRLEERLLPLVGQGDPEAFEVLYRSTEKAVYALALSILRNPHDAEDIVQETYLKVRAAAHLYVPQGKPWPGCSPSPKIFAGTCCAVRAGQRPPRMGRKMICASPTSPTPPTGWCWRPPSKRWVRKSGRWCCFTPPPA